MRVVRWALLFREIKAKGSIHNSTHCEGRNVISFASLSLEYTYMLRLKIVGLRQIFTVL
jgi:hypothetical protein